MATRMTSAALLSDDLTETVRRIALSATRFRPDLVDDAIQEGLCAAWLLPEDSSEGLRVTVARRAVLDLLAGRPSVVSEKGGRRRYEPTPEVSFDGPHDDDFDRIFLEAVDGAIDFEVSLEKVLALSSASDSAIVRAFLATSSLTAAAEILGLKPNTVRARWSRHIAPTLRIAFSDKEIPV